MTRLGVGFIGIVFAAMSSSSDVVLGSSSNDAIQLDRMYLSENFVINYPNSWTVQEYDSPILINEEIMFMAPT